MRPPERLAAFQAEPKAYCDHTGCENAASHRIIETASGDDAGAGQFCYRHARAQANTMSMEARRTQ